MENEQNSEDFEFDLIKYLNSDCDNLSMICDDSYLDLESILGIDSDSVEEILRSTTNESATVGDPVASSNSYDPEAILDENVPVINVNSFIQNECSSKGHKIVIPALKMTDETMKEIKEMSNPLVVQLGKTVRRIDKKRIRVPERKILASFLKARRSSKLDRLKETDLKDNHDRDLTTLEEQLKEFIHWKGSVLLPKNDNYNNNNEVVKSSEKVHLGNRQHKLSRNLIAILFTYVDSKSFAIMKSLCEDNIKDFVYQKGSILLPKRTKRKSQIQRTEVKTKTSVSDATDPQKKTPSKTAYPLFKLNYLNSFRKRLERIDRVPIAEREVEICLDGVTDEEKLIMSEFFQDDTLSSRYQQIRNHIVGCWKSMRPSFVSKTFVRSGLKNCGDVNNIGLVHRYLERIGAINFACDLVHYSCDRSQVKTSPSTPTGEEHQITTKSGGVKRKCEFPSGLTSSITRVKSG